MRTYLAILALLFCLGISAHAAKTPAPKKQTKVVAPKKTKTDIVEEKRRAHMKVVLESMKK